MFYEQLLELSKVRVEGVEKTPTQIILHCYQDHSTGICPHCQQSTTQIHQYSHRQVRDLNILNREVWLHIRVKNYVCLGCAILRKTLTGLSLTKAILNDRQNGYF